jgi:hypothetical protein
VHNKTSIAHVTPSAKEFVLDGKLLLNGRFDRGRTQTTLIVPALLALAAPSRTAGKR